MGRETLKQITDKGMNQPYQRALMHKLVNSQLAGVMVAAIRCAKFDGKFEPPAEEGGEAASTPYSVCLTNPFKGKNTPPSKVDNWRPLAARLYSPASAVDTREAMQSVEAELSRKAENRRFVPVS